MAAKDEWAERSKRYLKAELKRREITYAELSRRLGAIGIDETEGSITVKINRGQFPTWFFVATLKVIGCSLVKLDDIDLI